MNVLIVVTSADTLAPGRPTGVWLEEFAIPFTALCEVGIDLVVASPKGGAAPIDPKTTPDDKARARWSQALEALGQTAPLAEVSEGKFDAVFFPGGHGPMVDLATDKAVAALVSAFAKAGKIIAALCHGPAALLNARGADGEPLLKGRRVTGFTNGEEVLAGLDKVTPFLLEDRIRAAGGKFEHALLPGACHVVIDGDLITGQNPASSEALAKALSEALSARQRAALAVGATVS